MAPPLLLACALSLERRALRSGIPPEAAGPVAVLRTGMGPERAARSVAGRLAREPFRAAPVIATGFCAGLSAGMRPGDVVVAETTEEVRGGGATACVHNGPLLDALELLGARVHTGLLLGSDRVVRGAAGRAKLRARGAVAVDMESAATLRAASAADTSPQHGDRPVAAVRVVVDAPEHELMRIGTLRGGIAAFRVLSSVLPALFEWHRNVLLPRR